MNFVNIKRVTESKYVTYCLKSKLKENSKNRAITFRETRFMWLEDF